LVRVTGWNVATLARSDRRRSADGLALVRYWRSAVARCRPTPPAAALVTSRADTTSLAMFRCLSSLRLKRRWFVRAGSQ
jgi:hypothetical protein